MKIVKYTLESGNKPSHITNGGWWHNPDDDTYIGFSETGTELTSADVETRQLGIHANYPMMKEVNTYAPMEGTSDPDASTNAPGTPTIYCNTVTGSTFQCSDATPDANVWIKKSHNQVPGDMNDPLGMLLPTVMHPPFHYETAVEMSEAEIRHFIQYWVSQNI
jgi:hypothetical protein